MGNSNIVFFDGVCNLCNRSVDFFIRHDKKNQLLFAPLQGETAHQILPDEKITDMSSFIYYSNGKIYERSTAAIYATAELSGGWICVKILLIVPRFLRDVVYNYIAKNRYKWFGKKSTCRLPTPNEKSKFLI